MSGARTPIDAKRAQREAIDSALALPLTATDLRVLLALLNLVSLYDRLEDRVSNRQLCEATGIIDDRRVRRSIKRLSEFGVVEREPGSSEVGGRRIASLFRFPTGRVTEPGLEEPPGVDPAHDRGSIRRGTGVSTYPLPRSSPRYLPRCPTTVPSADGEATRTPKASPS